MARQAEQPPDSRNHSSPSLIITTVLLLYSNQCCELKYILFITGLVASPVLHGAAQVATHTSPNPTSDQSYAVSKRLFSGKRSIGSRLASP